MAAPAGFDGARRRLLGLSLLAPVRFAEGDDEQFLVHRWTAGALAKRASAEEHDAAHHAAAAYWHWRAAKKQQSRTQDIADYLEARHHYHAVGDIASVHQVTGYAVNQLETWGAWDWEERLLRETLAWIPEQSTEAASLLGQLSTVSLLRGDYDAALDLCQQALAIFEALGERARMATSYHQLGALAQHRGDLARLQLFGGLVEVKALIPLRLILKGRHHRRVARSGCGGGDPGWRLCRQAKFHLLE